MACETRLIPPGHRPGFASTPQSCFNIVARWKQAEVLCWINKFERCAWWSCTSSQSLPMGRPKREAPEDLKIVLTFQGDTTNAPVVECPIGKPARVGDSDEMTRSQRSGGH